MYACETLRSSPATSTNAECQSRLAEVDGRKLLPFFVMSGIPKTFEASSAKCLSIVSSQDTLSACLTKLLSLGAGPLCAFFDTRGCRNSPCIAGTCT